MAGSTDLVSAPIEQGMNSFAEIHLMPVVISLAFAGIATAGFVGLFSVYRGSRSDAGRAITIVLELILFAIGPLVVDRTIQAVNWIP